MIDATAIILTKNEEINLPDCLKSLQGFAKRCVVVDSGSTDATEKIAKDLGADFYFHEFENYSKQFNWAIDNTGIDTRWTIRIDADERFPEELKKEYEKLVAEHENDDVSGIISEAWLYFLGKKIKHGCRNKRKINLFKTGIGRIEDRNMDEHTVLSSGRIVKAKNKYIHYDFKDLDQWIKKLNWYATREAMDYFEFRSGAAYRIEGNDKALMSVRKKKFGIYYRFPMFLRSRLLFIYNYVFRLGFLDGRAGFIYNYMYHRWYRALVDAKIYEHKKFKKEFEKTKALD